MREVGREVHCFLHSIDNMATVDIDQKDVNITKALPEVQKQGMIIHVPGAVSTLITRIVHFIFFTHTICVIGNIPILQIVCSRALRLVELQAGLT